MKEMKSFWNLHSKRILSFMLATVMVISLLPISALAESNTAVTVAGVDVTVGGYFAVTDGAVATEAATEAPTEGGWVHYDAETSTLTLSGAEISTANHGIELSSGTLSVVVAADSTITLTASSKYGIYAQSGTALNFSGAGALTVQNSNSTYGIYLTGAILNFTGGTLLVNNTSENRAYGIYLSSSSTANVTGGTVQARAIDLVAYGIYVSSSTANVSGGTVQARAIDSVAYGIYVSSSTANVSGGTICGESANYRNYGIYNYGTLYLSGTPAVTGGTADVCQNYVGNTSRFLQANNGKTGDEFAYYTGDALSLACDTYNSYYYGEAVVLGVSDTHTETTPLFTIASDNHYLEFKEGNLLLQGVPVALTWMDGETNLTGTDDAYPATVPYNSSITLPALTHENYIFVGWKMNDDDTILNGSVYTTAPATIYAVWANPFAGSGTEADPWQITTAEDLQNLATIIDADTATLRSSYNTDAIYYQLTDDINLSSVCSEALGSWNPIGTSDIWFKAKFDGNGKTISNLYINEDSICVGLFATLDTGIEVKNLTMTGSVTANRYFGPLGYGYAGDTAENNNDTSGVRLYPYGYTHNGTMAYRNMSKEHCYDVKGVYNGNFIQTTYDNVGYKTITENLDNATVTSNASFINGGRYVKIAYTVTAGDTAIADGKLGVHADVQIADNDRAAVEVIKEGDAVIGLKMANDSTESNYHGSQFNLYFRNAYGVADADTYWFGHYSNRENYAFVQLNGNDSSTYPSGTKDNYNNDFTAFSSADSGLALSWQDIDLAPGESETFSFIVGIGEKEDPPKFDPTTPLSFDISSYQEEKKIEVTAIVTDTAGQTDGLYYTVNDGDETLLGSVLADGTAKTIQEDIDLSGFTDGVYTFKFWLLNTGGATSGIVERTIIIRDGSATVTEETPYTVKFSMQGHGTAVTEQYVISGGKIVKPTDPTADGYTFGGWYKDQGCTQTWDFTSDTVTKNTTLFAKWTQIVTHTVTFNANGGTGTMADQTVTEGVATALTQNAFTRTGYSFLGWSESAAATTATYADEADVTLTTDKTLYAVWKANQYTITFDTAGGSAIAAITQDYGTTITVPANPTKTGYTFAGWDKTIPSTMPAENMTITAQWAINQYTITFNTAGGSTIAAITQNYGTAVAAPANPSKTGYTFAGWDKAIPSTMPAEDMTITAQWAINQYTITFNTAGGSTIASITQNYGTAIVAPADPTKTGYTFAGWDKTIPSTMPTENMTVTANWVDDIAPTATVEVDATTWDKLLESLTFGLYHSTTEYITITASDNGSGVDKVYYYIDTTASAILDPAAITAWTEYNSANKPSVNTNTKYVVYVKVVDNASNVTYISTERLVHDAAKPVVNLNANGYTDGTWTKGNVTLSITNDTANIGDAKFEYRIGDGNWQDYTEAIVIAQDTNGTVYSFRITSKAGVTSDVKTITVKVDKTTPTNMLFGDTVIYKKSDNFEISTGDMGSGVDKVEVKKDNGEYTDITSTYQSGYTVTANGTYTVKVTDNAGNFKEESITYTKIDSAKPVVNLNTNGYTDGAWTTDNVTLSITNDTDNLGTDVMEYKVGEGNWQTYSGDIVISADTNGTVYSFRITSNAGVVSDVKTVTVKMDKTAPTIALNGDTVTYKTEDTFTITPTENGSGVAKVEVKKDSGNYAEVTTGNYKVTANGTYTIKITDIAGNFKEESITYDKIDSTKPIVNLNSGAYTDDTWTTSDVTLSITNDADNLGTDVMEYKVGEGQWQAYTAPIVVNADTNGTVYSFRITSNAGVASDVKRITVKRDATAATVRVEANATTWDKLLESLTFGTYHNEEKTVTITATDAGSEIDKVYYFIDLSPIDKKDEAALVALDWTEYNENAKPKVTEDSNYVVYVKVTDKAGNVKYISTNGLVLDTTVPTIEGIADGATYFTTQKVTVADSNIASVTVNAAEQTETTFNIAGNTDKEYTVTVTDKAGNSVTYTFTLKAIPTVSEDIKDLNEANVKASDKETIEKVKEDALAIDTTDATDEEKAAIKAIIGKCDALLDAIEAQKQTSSPQTGDNSNMFLWIVLLFISGGALTTLTIYDRKRRAVKK